MRRLHTDMPLGSERSSGSRVRFPVRMTRLMLVAAMVCGLLSATNETRSPSLGRGPERFAPRPWNLRGLLAAGGRLGGRLGAVGDSRGAKVRRRRRAGGELDDAVADDRVRDPQGAVEPLEQRLG